MTAPDDSVALPADPRVAVVGCGSIGSLLAAHLTEHGTRVCAIDPWYPHVEELRRDGVRISTPDEQVRVRLAAHHVDEVPDLADPFDLVLLGVKSYDSALALGLLTGHLHEESVVVPVQNGLNESWIASLLPRGHLVGCSVHVPAELTAPGRVTRYLPRSRRTFSFGTLGPATAADEQRASWVARLTGPAGGTEAVADLAAVKWAKLAVNTMVNAPAGITGWTTRQLWTEERTVPLVVRAAGETLAVAAARGVHAAPVFGVIEPRVLREALVDREAYREACAGLELMVAERSGASESRPSLLQDLQRGRRSEIDYLNGLVVRAGAEAGVPTPVNRALVHLVREIDRGRRGIDPANLTDLERLLGEDPGASG